MISALIGSMIMSAVTVAMLLAINITDKAYSNKTVSKEIMHENSDDYVNQIHMAIRP